MQLFAARSPHLPHFSIGPRLRRAFPTPALLTPVAAGVDISDASIKWLSLVPYKSGWKVGEYGTADIPPGIVVQGSIKDHSSLVRALTLLKKEARHLTHAHAALPEEAGYVFSMRVHNGSSRSEIMNMIEFSLEDRVPISLKDAVYDFDIIGPVSGSPETEIAVVAFPLAIAESYVAAFEEAGIELLSLEIEARSIGRAVSNSKASVDEATLLVDFGRTRTGFAILRRGIPIFTSTVEIGGDMIDRALTERLALAPEARDAFKNDQGVFASDQKGAEAILGVAASLADEVARLYRYSDTRRDEHGGKITPVTRVLLTGGSANLKGITEYIAGKVQSEVERADTWGNVCRYDEYIPPVSRQLSYGYATAIGLALRCAL